jgi:hypothetical protein
MALNCVAAIAHREGRTYITPEDVGEALQSHSLPRVRRAVLEVLGKATDFGAEDDSLCAFIAFKGRRRVFYEPPPLT